MRRMRYRWAGVVCAAAIGVLLGAGPADGKPSGSWGRPKESKSTKTAAKRSATLYEQGMDAVESKEYRKAVRLFEKSQKLDRKNPDILNMLAFSHRKLGKIDKALELYQQALKLRPKFPEAREYMGEAYLQAALREVKTLRRYGADGEAALAELIEAFRQAASSLD